MAINSTKSGNGLKIFKADKLCRLLVSTIEENFDVIVSKWIERLQRDIDSYKRRPVSELRNTISEHLGSLLDALSTGNYDRLFAFVRSIAPLRISHSFPISGVQQAFFIGRAVLCEEIFQKVHLSPKEIIKANRLIEVPFERAILVYSDVYEHLQVQEAEARTRQQAKLEQEKKTIQTERMAMVGQMAAKVAHEIRNPLSSISLNTELLEDEILSFANVNTDEASELIRSIAVEVDRLAQLSDEYLRFSRLPALKFSQCNMNSVINDLVRFQRKSLSRKNITIKSQLDKRLPNIRIDKEQLRRAILNLLRNAAEAMPEGGPIILQTDQQNSNIRILVEDSGIGIAPEDMTNIFNPFFSTKSVGTGLGLSITRQIVEEHGGTISCQSQPGKGTAFTIQLPLNGKPYEIAE